MKAAIVDSARKVPAWAGRSVIGGIADAQAAVELCQDRRGIPRPPRPPTPTDRTAPALTVSLASTRISRRATLRLRLDEPARITLRLERRDRRGRYPFVATPPSIALGAGRVSRSVTLRERSGRRLRRGSYRLRIRATDLAGNTSRYLYRRFRATGR